MFLQEPGAAAFLSVEVLDENHSLKGRSPARLGEVLTVLPQRHTGVLLLSRLKAPFKGEHRRYCAVRSGRECCRWQSHAGRELPQEG